MLRHKQENEIDWLFQILISFFTYDALIYSIFSFFL